MQTKHMLSAHMLNNDEQQKGEKSKFNTASNQNKQYLTINSGKIVTFV